MKTKLIFQVFVIVALFCFTQQTNAQFIEDAPWRTDLIKSKSLPTFVNEVEAFDAYWKTRDHTKKGSGFKPFMRWQEYWKNSLLPDGTIPTAQHLWNAWEEKRNMISSSKIAAPNWIPMGPFDHDQASSWSPGQGRVNVAIVDPNNANIFYAGSPAGGIWKSNDKGANWTPLTDKLPQIGVSGIAIDPKNSEIIYISTGDDDARDSYSIGVLKSTDGGNSWKKTGLEFTNTSTTSNDIFIDPKNSNNLWVATSVGLYKTTNAGASWTRTLSGNIRDVKLKPGNADVIYAVTSNSFYKSTNGGNNFSKIQSGLPADSGRLTIDVTPANANYVYLLSAKKDYSFQGLYRSTNSGSSFTKRQETRNIFENTQAWYDLALAVSDKNANTVFVGCLNVWKSTDGGNGFTKINNWSSPSQATYTHADIHFLRYYNGKLFCGSDGGFYVSENNGSSFTDLTKGMQIGQFYRISVAENSDSHRLVGGLQDNGGYALRDSKWYNYFGADGMDCAVSGNNSNTYYGFIQFGGQLRMTKDRGLTQQFVASGPEKGNWVTPLVSDKNGILYAGYSNFYKVENNKFTRLSTFNFGGNIDYIELDPININTMYVAKDKGLYKSTDKGVNWSKIFTFQTNITSIEVNNDDRNVIYATTSGSSGGVFESSNQGANFTNISSGLPSEAKLIVRHQKGSESIYLGTYLGVYHKKGNGAWENYSSNLPNASVRDLEINLKDKVLLAATYGRGIWKVPLAGSDNGGNQTAYKTHNIPGTIQAEDYDNGGQGVAYNDVDSSNNGGQGRTNEAVDIEKTTDIGGGTNVGWIANGEWLEYTIADVKEGSYDISFRIASTNANTKSIEAILGDTNLGKVDVPKTGAWQAWETVKLSNINISKGSNVVLRLKMNGGSFNVNYVNFKTRSLSNDAPIGKYISLRKSGGDQLYVAAENNNDRLIADRGRIGSWEKFLVEEHPDGGIALKAFANSLYVMVPNLDTNTAVKPRGSSKGNWERFEWKSMGDGKVALKSLHSGKWLQAAWNEDKGIIRSRGADSKNWETFNWKEEVITKEDLKIAIKEELSSLNLYPNPANKVIYVDIPKKSISENAYLNLYDNLGRNIKSQEVKQINETIDISDLPAGIYFIKIMSSKQLLQKTFVKQ